MSTLISSALSGQKAAPKKMAPRRRLAPPPSPAKQATPISVASASTSIAPPSPPPTQPTETPLPAEPTESAAPTSSPAPASPVETRVRIQAPSDPIPSRSETPHSAPAPENNAQSADSEEDAPPPSPPPPPPPKQQPSRKRKQDQPSAKEAAPPAKRAKRSSARSNATVQAAVQEDEAPATRTRTASSRTTQSKSKKKQVVEREVEAEPDTEEQAVEQDAEHEETQTRAPKPKAKPARRKRAQQPPAYAATEVEVPPQEDKQAAEPAEEADEDAEDSDPELHEIDPNTVTMHELSTDKTHGKTSEREKKMAEIDWVDVARKRREAIDHALAASEQPPPATEVRETTEGPSGTAEPPPEPVEGAATVGGVTFRVVNGQIVEDETSLTIDRQAQAEAEALTNEPIEEENDLTRRINRVTWLNDRRRQPADRVPMWKQKSEPWNEEDTERFYKALAMFGTDFQTISNMFPGKTRRQIKHKFTREEKLDRARIDSILIHRKVPAKRGQPNMSWNLEHYARETGRDIAEFTRYEGAEHAEQVIRESMKSREREMEEAIREEELAELASKEAAQVRKQNRERQAAEKRKAGAKEKGPKGKVAKKKRGGATMGGGGGPVEAEGGDPVG